MHGVLIGLVIVLSVAAAAVFGLFLQRHGQYHELNEERALIEYAKTPLNARIATLNDLLKTEQLPSGRSASAAGILTAKINERVELIMQISKQAQSDSDAQNNVLEAAVKDNDALRQNGNAHYAKLLKEMSEKRDEIAKEEERFYGIQRDNESKRRDVEEKVKAAADEVERVKKVGRDRLVVLDARIAELEQRKAELTRQFAHSNELMKPDGAIVQSAAESGYVVLDRGQKHHLRVGTRFTVFIRRASKIVEKGQIEVISVAEAMSTARVVSEPNRNEPIIAGDFIHNPIYDPAKTMTFVVNGTFKKYNQDEIKRFIVEAGGAVASELGVGVDFLIAGSESEPSVEQAIRLGIMILSEPQVLEFVRPTAKPESNR